MKFNHKFTTAIQRLQCNRLGLKNELETSKIGKIILRYVLERK